MPEKTAQQHYMDGALTMLRQIRYAWQVLCDNSPDADNGMKTEYAELLKGMERDIERFAANGTDGS